MLNLKGTNVLKRKKEMHELIRDRGSKKWVSMMLPEHVKLLKEYNESLLKVKKPILDEQKLQEFNEIISEAMKSNLPLQFTYYYDGVIKILVGRIQAIDSFQRELRIMALTNDIQTLFLEDILEIERN